MPQRAELQALQPEGEINAGSNEENQVPRPPDPIAYFNEVWEELILHESDPS